MLKRGENMCCRTEVCRLPVAHTQPSPLPRPGFPPECVREDPKKPAAGFEQLVMARLDHHQLRTGAADAPFPKLRRLDAARTDIFANTATKRTVLSTCETKTITSLDLTL